MKKIIFAALAVVATASCAKQDNLEVEYSETQEIQFTSGIESRVSGNEWEVGDLIGLYCQKDGELTYDNIAYEAQNSGSATSFTVAEGYSTIYKPGAESYSLTLDAYYPYVEGVSYGEYIPFDISDQSDLSKIDFMSATATADQSTIGNGVAFTFSHDHTLVQLNIEAAASISSLDNLIYRLSNIQTAGAAGYNGDPDEGYSDMIEYGTISSAQIAVSEDGKSATIEMILFPTDSYTTDATLTLLLAGMPYVASFNTTLYKGMQQNYTIQLGDNELSIGEATIVPWGSAGDTSDIYTTVE